MMKEKTEQVKELLREKICNECVNFNICWVESNGYCNYFSRMFDGTVNIKNRFCRNCAVQECIYLCNPLKNKILSFKVEDEEI